MNALILAPFDKEYLEKLCTRLDTVVYESWLDTRCLQAPDELIKRLKRDKVSILIVESDFVLEEVFQQVPGLKFVGVCRNAVTHVDVEAATEHGVVVVNCPGRNSPAVAELVIGLIFSLARHIPAAHSLVMTGQWEDPVSPYLRFRGIEVAEKTLGIVGLGSIGSEVARKARGLGMTVVAHDPYLAESPSGLEVPLVGLGELLATSDFVSLHLPLQADHVINKEDIAKMKRHSYLINTATPGAVEEGALIRALKDRSIAGAALDVHEAAPLPPNHPLLKLDNVILTPHIGGATNETVTRHSRMIFEALADFLEGRCPCQAVNPLAWGKRD